MTTARWRVALAVLGVVAAAAAVLTNLALFPLYSFNRDDSVYVAMARLMQTGVVTLPADADPFRPWASAVVGDRIVLKYTPPWPAVIAAGELLTGSPRAALAVSAAAAAVLVALLAAEVLRDRAVALGAGALFALSPVVVVQSGTYLPYLFSLALGLGAAVLLLSGTRLGSTPRLVAAGAVAGVAAFARPFDALLTVAPFALAALLARERGGLSRIGVVWRVAVGALPVLTGSLVYNAAVVGGPFRLPFTVTGPQDTFGFGDRGVFPQYTVHFTAADGVAGLLANLAGTPGWVFGGLVLVVLAGLGAFRSRPWSGAQRAVAALSVVVPLGYLPFWGPHAITEYWEGLELFGPFYWLPVVVPLTVFGAAGLARVAQRRRPLAAVAVAAMVGLTALAAPGPVTGNREVTAQYREMQRAVAAAGLDDALLFLPRRGDLGFESDTPFLENDPALRQPVLYAEQRGAADLALAERFPGRSLHRLSEDDEGPPVVEPLRVDAGPTVTLRLRLTAPPGAVAYLRAGDRTTERPLDPSGEVTWTVTAPGAPTTDPEAVVLPGDGVLAVGVAARSPGDDGPGDRWERRLAHRTVAGGTRVELLRPGQAWAREDDGSWVPDATGSPVEEIG